MDRSIEQQVLNKIYKEQLESIENDRGSFIRKKDLEKGLKEMGTTKEELAMRAAHMALDYFKKMRSGQKIMFGDIEVKLSDKSIEEIENAID